MTIDDWVARPRGVGVLSLICPWLKMTWACASSNSCRW